MNIPTEQPEVKTEGTDGDKILNTPLEKLLCGIEQIIEGVRVEREKLEYALTGKVLAEKEKLRLEEERLADYFKQGEIFAINMFRDKGKPTSLPFGEKPTPISTPEEYVDEIKILFIELYRDFQRRKTVIYDERKDFVTERITRNRAQSGDNRRFPETADFTRKLSRTEIEELRLKQKKETTELLAEKAFVGCGYQYHIEGFVTQAILIGGNGTIDDRQKRINMIIDLLVLLHRWKNFCKFENMVHVIDNLIEFIKTLTEKKELDPAKLANIEAILDEIHGRIKGAF